MGMLTDFIQGAAKSASGIADNKLKEMTEENLLQKKAAIELEREKRIEEAQMRMHDKLRGEQLDDYGRTRADKVTDTAEQRAYESQKDDKDFEQSKSLTNLQAENANQNAESAFNRNKSWATYPNNPDAIKSQVESKLKQMEFEQKAQVNSLIQQYQSETDPAKKEIIADSIDALTGKRAERLQKVEVQIGKDDLGKPILQDVLYDTKRQKVVDVQGQYDTSHKPPMSETDIDALAREKVGKEPFWDSGNEWETKLNAEKARLRNGRGMIGSVINKDIPDSMKTGNEAHDTMLKTIMLGESSGNPTAQNKTSSAGGLFQLTDDTAIGYGAKADANGKVSYAEKNRVAKNFYEDMDKRFNGDIPKILAAGFGQNGIENAVNAAEKAAKSDPKIDPSVDWVKFTSPTIQENMPTVVNRAKQVIVELSKSDEPIPPTLSKFYSRYRNRS